MKHTPPEPPSAPEGRGRGEEAKEGVKNGEGPSCAPKDFKGGPILMCPSQSRSDNRAEKRKIILVAGVIHRL